jgi:type I restriction enzyme S subunit
MSKNNENKLVPRLRFPEFEDSGEWVEKKLGEVFKSFSGGTPDTSKKEYYNGKIPFIRSAEIGKLSTELFITETGLENSSAKMVKKGDLLVALYGANSGDVAISKIDGAINQAILCFQSEYSNEFTCHFLSGKKNWIVSKYVQGGQGNLSGEIVKSISLPFPSLPEQQKIASCLSSLDEVITAESQKLELYQQHKKGLLQNLFPQEGETVPKLRFPEFQNAGEWEKAAVGNLFKFKQGVQVPVEKQFSVKTNDRIRFIRIIDITSSSEPFRYIHNPGNEYLIGTNDLFMIRYGTPGLISIGFEGVIANNLFRIIWKYNDFYVPKFWFYAFQKIEKLIYGLSSSSSMPAISFSTMDGILLAFPKNPEEQQRIASCLSSLDDLINAQRQKIEMLQRHKKGLLQGLFPPINN